MTLRPVFTVLLCTYIITESSSVESSASVPVQGLSNTWNNVRSNFNQQTLENALSSIDERLRNLDSMYSSRYTTRWEISMEQQSRRLESIESRLGRMEALLEIRVDKITENLSSRYLKEELVKDQITRKLDSTYERLNHRLGYMEARFDMAIAKLQSNIDTTMIRFEQMEAAAANRQVDIESEIITVETNLEDLKKQMKNFEEFYNTTSIAGSVCETFNDHTYQLIATTENLKKDLNGSYMDMVFHNEQQYHLTEEAHKNIINLLTNITGEINKKTVNFTNKTDSMYNEIRKKLQNTESVVKDSMSLNNATRRDVQDSYRSLLLQMGRRGIFPSDREKQKEKETQETLEFSLDELTTTVLRRFTDLEGQLDSSFQMLQMSQNLFLESCHRIQLDEPQLEMKLIEVLEKILDTLNNRSFHIENGVENVHQVLKSHNSQIIRTLGQTANNVKQVSQQSSENMSHVEKMFLGIQHNILDANKNIENIMNDFMNENIKSTEKLDMILITIQEMQENVNYSEQENVTELLTETSDELQKVKQLVKQIHQEFNHKCQEADILNITFVKLLAQEVMKSGRMSNTSENLNNIYSKNDKINFNLTNNKDYKLQDKKEMTENNSDIRILVNKLKEHVPKNETQTYNGRNQSPTVLNTQNVPYKSHNACYDSNNKECGYESHSGSLSNNTVTQYNDTVVYTANPVTIKILPNYTHNMNYTNIGSHEEIMNGTEEFIKINLDNVAAIMHSINTNRANQSHLTDKHHYRLFNVDNVTILIESENTKGEQNKHNYPEITLQNYTENNNTNINNVTEKNKRKYEVKNNMLQSLNSSTFLTDAVQSKTEQSFSEGNDNYTVLNGFHINTKEHMYNKPSKIFEKEHETLEEERQYTAYSTLKENQNITLYGNKSTNEMPAKITHYLSQMNKNLDKPKVQKHAAISNNTRHNTDYAKNVGSKANNISISSEEQPANITMRMIQIYDKQYQNNTHDNNKSFPQTLLQNILNKTTNLNETDYEQHGFSTNVRTDKTVLPIKISEKTNFKTVEDYENGSQ